MSQNNDEVLVRVEGVSKKFCRSLKKSLWYGVCDIAGELLPGRKRESQRTDSGLLIADGTTKHTKLHKKGGAGPCLGEPSGAAFSNSSASELARDSENTSLTRCAGDPAGARIAPEDRRSKIGEREMGTAGENQRADSGEFLEGLCLSCRDFTGSLCKFIMATISSDSLNRKIEIQ